MIDFTITVIVMREFPGAPDNTLIYPFDFQSSAKLPGRNKKRVQSWLRRNRGREIEVLAVRSFGEQQIGLPSKTMLSIGLTDRHVLRRSVVDLIRVVARQMWEAGRDRAYDECLPEFQ